MINNKPLILLLILLIFFTGNSLFSYSVTNEWLDTKLVEWKPQTYKPMNFAAYHVFASDNMFDVSTSTIDIKMLDVLVETKSDIIVLYIRPQSYFSQKERYDNLINKIRSADKKLFIGARFNDVPMTFAEYSVQLSSYTQNIVASIKPDYYGIVIEPTTMETKYGFDVSDSTWVALVEYISNLSKLLSPATKTSVGGHKEELSFLQLVSNISSIDIIGFNIYDNQGIYPEYSGYLGTGDVVGKTIDLVNSKGKETWMLETWTTWIGSKAMDPVIDGKWLQVMSYYAQKHNMKVITAFFTGKFVYYGLDQTEFQSALNSGQRTAPFYAYKSVIEEVPVNVINEWIDKKLVEWKPQTCKQMMFTVVDWPLQTILTKMSNANTDDLFLKAMFELNTNAIYFSILPQSYDIYKDRYDQAVQKIREKNKVLIISYNVAGKLEGDPTFNTPPTVEEYITKEKQYIDYYVGYYHPDYFLVAVEASTLNRRVENNWSAADWERIIKETSEYAKTVDPNVKVGAILTIADFPVFDKIKNMNSLDVIGFNVYGNRRIYEEYEDINPLYSGDSVGNRLDEIRTIGKEPWILETWVSSADNPVFNSATDIDAKWLRVMSYYVQKHGAKNVMPFFTAKFIVEKDIFDFTEIENELTNNKRTSAFYSFKDLIQEFPVIVTIFTTNILATSITGSSAAISWTTNEPTTSIVKYGTTSGSYGQEVTGTELTTQHSLPLVGLAPETKYYYIVISTDSSGNTGRSNEYSFSTVGQVPIQDDLEQIINIYPNPYVKGKSSGEKIRFKNLGQGAVINLYSISGELVEELSGGSDGKTEWDISNVSSGVYLYVIKTDLSDGTKKGKVGIIK